jgi:tRNA(fMet)-specific endonuclease VapC
MTFALDTNIISYWLKNLYNIGSIIEKRLEEKNSIVIPPMSYYEILRGLYANNSVNKLKHFEGLCSRFGVRDMKIESWTQSALLYSKCKKSGHPMEDADLLQAAFCIENRYILVTHNAKHFSHVEDLAIENWVGPDEN